MFNMKQNNNPKFTPRQIQKWGCENTAQKIQELNQQLENFKNYEQREELETALRGQWNYIRQVANSVERREIYQSLAPVEREAKWKALRAKLTTWENQTDEEQEQTNYDLFALLDRPQIQERVTTNLGRLGTILNPNLDNLKSFSEGGWYDIVYWTTERLSNCEPEEISREFIEEETVQASLLSILYEIKNLAANTAQELDLDIDF
jgi:hypothetical protein